MDTIQFGRLIVIPFPIIFTLCFIPLLKKQRNGKTVVYKLILSSLFLAIAGYSALFVPIILWVHLAGIAAMHYWVFCIYLATDHIINNKRYLPVLRNPAFAIVTGLTITNLIIDFLRQSYLTPFIDYDPPIRTWLYFSGEMLHYITMTYLCAISLRLYFVRFHQPNTSMYTVRFISGFMAFMLGFVGTGLINVGIAIIWMFPK